MSNTWVVNVLKRIRYHIFSVAAPSPFPQTVLERQDQLPAQTSDGTQHRHDPHGNPKGNPQPCRHNSDDCAQDLLDDDIAGKKQGNDDGG